MGYLAIAVATVVVHLAFASWYLRRAGDLAAAAAKDRQDAEQRLRDVEREREAWRLERERSPSSLAPAATPSTSLPPTGGTPSSGAEPRARLKPKTPPPAPDRGLVPPDATPAPLTRATPAPVKRAPTPSSTPVARTSTPSGSPVARTTTPSTPSPSPLRPMTPMPAASREAHSTLVAGDEDDLDVEDVPDLQDRRLLEIRRGRELVYVAASGPLAGGYLDPALLALRNPVPRQPGIGAAPKEVLDLQGRPVALYDNDPAIEPAWRDYAGPTPRYEGRWSDRRAAEQAGSENRTVR